jgi:hypothetical protein
MNRADRRRLARMAGAPCKELTPELYRAISGEQNVYSHPSAVDAQRLLFSESARARRLAWRLVAAAVAVAGVVSGAFFYFT